MGGNGVTNCIPPTFHADNNNNNNNNNNSLIIIITIMMMMMITINRELYLELFFHLCELFHLLSQLERGHDGVLAGQCHVCRTGQCPVGVQS